MPAIIQIQSLCKSFVSNDSVVDILKSIDLTVDKEDVYGIIGLSGAGKSTLIRTLIRLVTPTSGKILFHDTDIGAMDKHALRKYRKKIGMIFQHFNLLTSRTVAENIAYPLEISGVPRNAIQLRVDKLLGFVGLSEKKNTYPAQLSGGEKQRVGIARALANNPEVLLCDEATSALDPKTTKEILTLLKGVNREFGVTIILITHEMEVIRQTCNKLAVLEKGSIVEEGDVVELFSDPKHPTTRAFLQRSIHDIPADCLSPRTANRKLLRLTFKGSTTAQPVISELVRKCDVDTNILMGWIDRLQAVTIGTLVIELSGTPEGIGKALNYLKTKDVHHEVIENGVG